MVLANVAALAVGCSTTYPNEGGDDAPDGGVGETDGGDGSGSGSGFVVELMPTTIKDERGDQISFTAEGPTHTHAGPPITLGAATGCPEVSKYSYLLDPQAPEYGNELTPNPLAFAFQAHGGDSITTADYQVIGPDQSTVRDWTPAAKVDARYGVTLYRSGATGIPALGSVEGTYKINFRAVDAVGREAIQSACWKHKPLAAPLKFTGLSASSDPDALKAFSLTKNSPVSTLINGVGGDVKVFSGKIEHTTSEPVTIKFDITKPAVSYTKTAVVDRLMYPLNGSVPCGNTCVHLSPNCIEEPPVEPQCNKSTTPPNDPVDVSTSGMISNGQWTVSVLDGSTVATDCAVSGQTATCNLPGRGRGAQARQLTVIARANQFSELSPGAGTVAEHAFWYLDYTGFKIVLTDDEFRCTSYKMDLPDSDGVIVHHCDSWKVYPKMRALDQVRLELQGSAMNVTTAVPALNGLPASPLTAPPYLSGGRVNGTGFSWDGGNDDLPGDQH
ncbi:MAG: hypothetical protein WKG01_38305 [Kofleriaceae bacterium]